MLKKCFAYLTLSLLLASPDAFAECPCKQKKQPRRQRNTRNVQQPAPQRMQPQRGAPRQQPQQGQLTNGQLANMIGEDEVIIYNINDKPKKSAQPAPAAAPAAAKPAPMPAPAPQPEKPAAAQPAPAPAPAPKPVATTQGSVVYPTSPAHLDSIVKENELVIVNIGTEWCGPCRNFMGPYKQSAQANPDIIHVKADADKLRGSKHIQGVNAYPTIKFFKAGKLQETCQGTSRFAGLCDALAKSGTVARK